MAKTEKTGTPVSIRFDDETVRLMDKLAEKLHADMKVRITKADVVRLGLRALAEKEGVPLPDDRARKAKGR